MTEFSLRSHKRVSKAAGAVVAVEWGGVTGPQLASQRTLRAMTTIPVFFIWVTPRL
jgi:hypothetical protein